MRLNYLFLLIPYIQPIKAVDPFRLVLADYPETNFTFLHATPIVSYTTKSFPNGVICDAIAYTSHDGLRPDDVELDLFRREWALKQRSKTCMLHIRNPRDPTPLNATVKAAWRKRGSPNDPRTLVDRYKAGLVVMALIKSGRIFSSSPNSEFIPILYVDSDTMFANTELSIDTLARKIERASMVTATEDRVCGSSKTFRCRVQPTTPSPLAVVLSLSNNCDRGYFTHSGAIFFRVSPLAGFLFDSIAESAETSIKTGRYKMGDQAVWDWMTETVFDIDWRRIAKLCHSSQRVLTRTACLYPEFLIRRTFKGLGNNRTGGGNQAGYDLLDRMVKKWQPLDNPWNLEQKYPAPLDMAWSCSRWFNAPSCPTPLRHDPLHSFHCGDFLWHLYGCRKSSWKDGFLDAILRTPDCKAVLP